MKTLISLVRFYIFLAAFISVDSAVFGQVAFDVNPMAPARESNSIGLMNQLPNSRMVDVQLDVSALFTPGDAAVITEYTVRIVSRHEDVQVADYSPRTECPEESDFSNGCLSRFDFVW